MSAPDAVAELHRLIPYLAALMPEWFGDFMDVHDYVEEAPHEPHPEPELNLGGYMVRTVEGGGFTLVVMAEEDGAVDERVLGWAWSGGPEAAAHIAALIRRDTDEGHLSGLSDWWMAMGVRAGALP